MSSVIGYSFLDFYCFKKLFLNQLAWRVSVLNSRLLSIDLSWNIPLILTMNAFITNNIQVQSYTMSVVVFVILRCFFNRENLLSVHCTGTSCRHFKIVPTFRALTGRGFACRQIFFVTDQWLVFKMVVFILQFSMYHGPFGHIEVDENAPSAPKP